MNASLVSIGIPNYNYAHYIENALNSIANQTYKNIEIIIVDDCSTDHSLSVIENWMNNYSGVMHIKLIKNNSNAGLTKVCNQVLQHAKGKYFQTLDADDIILPEKIEKQVKLLDTLKNTAFVYSNISVVNQEGLVIHPDYLGRINYDKDKMPSGNIFSRLFEFNFIPLPSVLVNTAYAKKVGGFDESLQVQDYYLWLKLSEKYDALYMPGITAMYRVHDSSMSNSSATNPRSVDSVLNIKFRYYKKGNDDIKKQIKKNIYFSAPYLYKHNYPSAMYWLKKNLLLNPSLKSVMYYAAKKLGVPFSLITIIKARISNG